MSDSRLVRWSPLGGLVWFVAYPIGFVLGTGEGETTAEVIDRAESNEAGIGTVQLVVLLSPLLLGLFVGGLCQRLRAAGADLESLLGSSAAPSSSSFCSLRTRSSSRR